MRTDYLMPNIIVTVLFTLTGCNSNELSRANAAKQIVNHYKFPIVDYATIALKQGGMYYYPIETQFNEYRDAGLITYSTKSGNYGARIFYAELTEEGESYVLDTNGDEVIVQLGEIEFIEVTGIKTYDEFNSATVEYVKRRTNVTPFGHILGRTDELINDKDEFQKYDDGWRIKGATPPRVFEKKIGNTSTNTSTSHDKINHSNPEQQELSYPESKSVESNSKTFEGAWFEIAIPTGFQVSPSLKSQTADGYESVFLRSRDGKVEFYIFSPQWNGEPSDIALNPSDETLKSSESKTSGSNTITWYTIKSNNGSYTRTYQDTKSNDGSIRWVIGLKYANQAAYDQYKEQYLKFKKSFTQLGD